MVVLSLCIQGCFWCWKYDFYCEAAAIVLLCAHFFAFVFILVFCLHTSTKQFVLVTANTC